MLRKSSVYWAWLAKRGDLATGWLHRAQNRRAQLSQIARPSRAPQTIEGCRVPGRRETPAARTMRLKVLKPYGYKTMTTLFLITLSPRRNFYPRTFYEIYKSVCETTFSFCTHGAYLLSMRNVRGQGPRPTRGIARSSGPKTKIARHRDCKSNSRPGLSLVLT